MNKGAQNYNFLRYCLEQPKETIVEPVILQGVQHVRKMQYVD